MCSIHGWYAWGDKRPDPIALRGMLLCGAERGGTAPNYSNDATGVAYQKDGEIRIIKDNGKKDCAGQITDVGRKTTTYIQFDDAAQRFIVCRAESHDACFGPLRRIGGEDI